MLPVAEKNKGAGLIRWRVGRGVCFDPLECSTIECPVLGGYVPLHCSREKREGLIYLYKESALELYMDNTRRKEQM